MQHTTVVMSALWQRVPGSVAVCNVYVMSTYQGQRALGAIQFLLNDVYLPFQIPPSDACIMGLEFNTGLRYFGLGNG